MKPFCCGEIVQGKGAWALFVLRIVAGPALAMHGWPKIQHAFTWLGPDVPGFLQALAALSEFGGGLAITIGLLTQLAALGIACTMSYAILLVHIKNGDPFVDPMGGHSWELAGVYLSIALALIFRGPGAISADGLLFKKKD